MLEVWFVQCLTWCASKTIYANNFPFSHSQEPFKTTVGAVTFPKLHLHPRRQCRQDPQLWFTKLRVNCRCKFLTCLTTRARDFPIHFEKWLHCSGWGKALDNATFLCTKKAAQLCHFRWTTCLVPSLAVKSGLRFVFTWNCVSSATYLFFFFILFLIKFECVCANDPIPTDRQRNNCKVYFVSDFI